MMLDKNRIFGKTSASKFISISILAISSNGSIVSVIIWRKLPWTWEGLNFQEAFVFWKVLNWKTLAKMGNPSIIQDFDSIPMPKGPPQTTSSRLTGLLSSAFFSNKQGKQRPSQFPLLYLVKQQEKSSCHPHKVLKKKKKIKIHVNQVTCRMIHGCHIWTKNYPVNMQNKKI